MGYGDGWKTERLEEGLGGRVRGWEETLVEEREAGRREGWRSERVG